MGLFNIKVAQIEFKSDAYLTALDEAIQTQIKQAVKQWVRFVVPSIPVYSGMSRGAFLPIGRYLNVSVRIRPSEKAKVRKPLRTPAMGAALSSFEFYSTKGEEYGFKFDSRVPQFLANEFSEGLGMPPLLHPTPWHSLEAGEDAFRRYVENILPQRIPNIIDFIVVV